MTRFLCFGLLACAALLVAAVGLLRELEPSRAIDGGPAAGPAVATPDEVALAAPVALSADRSAIDAQEPAPAPIPARQPDWSGPGRFQPERLPSNGIVEVRVVRDEDDVPIEGIEVRISHAGETETKTTDGLGSVVFTNVARPTARVSASLPGRMTQSRSECSMRDVPRDSLELRMYVERQIAVRVLDPTGATMSPAEWGIDARSARRMWIVATSRCGRVGFPVDHGDAVVSSTRAGGSGPCSRIVCLRGRGDACLNAVLGAVTIGTAVVAPGATEVEVRTDAAAIAAALAPAVLCVVDAANDAPIGGATLELDASGDAATTISAGADGRVHVALAAVDRASAIARACGYVARRVTIETRGASEIPIRLDRGRRIRGRVLDRDGTPVQGVRVSVGGDDLAVAAPSAADGTFELVGVAPGDATTLWAVSPTHDGRATVDCRASDVSGIEVRLDASKQLLQLVE